jgi:hypothetical protein
LLRVRIGTAWPGVGGSERVSASSPRTVQAGGVDVCEDQTGSRQLIQFRRQAAAASERLHHVGAQALQRDQHDLPRLWRHAGQRPGIGCGLALAKHRRHALVGHDAVERAVVEVVVAQGAEEFVVTVARQLALHRAAGRFAQAIAWRNRRDEGHERHTGADGQASRDAASRGARRPPDPHGNERVEQQRRTAKRCQPRADRIGLADVAEHLARVDQVVDGDEVEARDELPPEDDFARGDEQHRAHERGAERACRHRVQPPAGGSGWARKREQREGQQHESKRGQVVHRADEQDRRQVLQRPRSRRRLGRRQAESQQGVDGKEEPAYPTQRRVARRNAKRQ